MDERPILSLRDVLSALPCPEGFTADKVASKWQCRIAPMVTSEREMLHYFEMGVPCFGTPSQSAAVHERVAADGKHSRSFARKEDSPPIIKEDGKEDIYPDDGSYVNFVTNPKWAKFPSQKIAFHAGWAGPGTELDAEKLHTMVDSWMDVLNSGGQIDSTSDKRHPILNLQYFHRNDPTKDPAIPPLAALLKWPSFLEPKKGGHVCDTATRASKRGAVTWWHLDDGGEFVMQTSLAPTLEQREGKYAVDSKENTVVTFGPLPPQLRGIEPSPVVAETIPSRGGSSKVVPVKLFIYAPPDSYAWCMHDRETEDSGKVTATHLFRCNDEQLPPKGYLPILNVAVLTAGGPPLVSPPNIPHMVITLNDCVMTEQRRVADYFLDEVAYFLEKVKRWGSLQPVMYHYLRESLRDGGHVQSLIVRPLVRKFNENYLTITQQRSAESKESTDQEEDYVTSLPSVEELLNNRIFASLHAIDTFSDHFALTVKDRKVLNDVMDLSPETSALAFYKHKTAEGEDVVRKCVYHWDVEKEWETPCQIFNLSDKMSCAVVYDAGNSPVYGLPRPTAELAKRDWDEMHEAQEELNTKYKKAMGIKEVGSNIGADGKEKTDAIAGTDLSDALSRAAPPAATRVKIVIEADPLLDELF